MKGVTVTTRATSWTLCLLATVLLATSQPASAQVACPYNTATQPTEFRLNGAVTKHLKVDLDLLTSLPVSYSTVSFVSGSGLNTVTYVGVSLYDLLNLAELAPVTSATVPNAKNASLRTYAVVVGSDCYTALVSLAELLPVFGGQQILVAYGQLDANGNFEFLTAVGEGMARLVVPGDKAGGRFVSNIVHVKVVNASWE